MSGATSTPPARSAAILATDSTIRLSVSRGRCGPCCSVDPMGITITRAPPLIASATSFQVISPSATFAIMASRLPEPDALHANALIRIRPEAGDPRVRRKDVGLLVQEERGRLLIQDLRGPLV